MLDKNKVKLGIAPIAWTNDDMPDLGAENTFEQCISEMALAGFTGCEVGNKYPKDTAVLKKALDLNGKIKGIEEEMRVLYVALTRAKERLYISGGYSRKAMPGVLDTKEFLSSFN